MAKVVLITGCSSGFGKLAAEHLAKHGYIVYAGVRKTKDLKILPNTILLDVTWPQERINKVIHHIILKSQHLDVLINNAGYGSMGSVDSHIYEELRDQYETNVFGVFKVTKAVLPYMQSRRAGLIINISSVAGLIAFAYNGVYSSSKFALEALTKSLRVEQSVHGIRVTSVNPGMYQTDFSAKSLWAKNLTPHSLKAQTFMRNRTSTKRQNPMAFAHKIQEIIESDNPQANYLLGLDAHLAYYATRFLPAGLFDWLFKFAIKRFVKN